MKRKLALTAAGLLGALSFCSAQAQSTTALRATEIRADKLASAPVLSALPAGAPLAIMTIEGGWAQVLHASPAGKVTGWVRASSINLSAGASTASGMASGSASEPKVFQ